MNEVGNVNTQRPKILQRICIQFKASENVNRKTLKYNFD